MPNPLPSTPKGVNDMENTQSETIATQLRYTGVGVSPGRVIAPLIPMAPPVAAPPEGDPLVEEAEGAVERLNEAAKAVKAELKERAERARSEAAAEVLKATSLMAGDKALIKNAAKLVRNNSLSPERALWDAATGYADQMRAMGGYMAERAADIEDVRARIVAELRGMPAPGVPQRTEPFVLAAEDLAPADTAVLDPETVIALVTSSGGPQSHTAILARNLGLPAVVAANGVIDIESGTRVFVDGSAGSVVTHPGEEQEQAVAAWHRASEQLVTFNGHGALADGTEVALLANVGTADDAQSAAAAGAQGVGLLRTEFCFLGRDTEPTVEEQTEAYVEIFKAFGSDKVVVRTLDAGADKPLPFLTDTTEPNPALACVATVRTGPRRRSGTSAAGHCRRRGSDRGERVGHGSHDLYGGGGGTFRRTGPRGGTEGVRRDGRDPGRSDHRGADPGPSGLRVPGHQRPHPVHDGRRPHARLTGRTQLAVATGRAAHDRADGGGCASGVVGVGSAQERGRVR